MAKILTSEEFNEKIANGLVVIDFFADWCGPCKMLAPIFDEISKEMKDVNFYKVDVDQSIDKAYEYKVASVPTVLIFKDGELVDKFVGFMPKEQILEKINLNI